MVHFDENIPKREEGFWGLKVNGGPVREVGWFERKPMLMHFHSVRPKVLEEDPFPGIDILEVVRVETTEVGPPQLLAKNWFTDD